MREHKFRAYDRVESKIIYGIGIARGNYVLDFNGKIYDMEAGVVEKHRFILMQYTGLKDKNGKEIYDGDILNSLYRNDGCKGLYEMVWIDGGFAVRRHGKHQQVYVTITPGDWNRCEVIGNIYENPELLEVK